MQKLNVEMPVVKKCDVQNCGYNVNNNCHAKAITIGDYSDPGCDTFMDTSKHTMEKKRMAGVGACKVNGCKYNHDYECTAENIAVGFSSKKIHCLTYIPKP